MTLFQEDHIYSDACTKYQRCTCSITMSFRKGDLMSVIKWTTYIVVEIIMCALIGHCFNVLFSVRLSNKRERAVRAAHGAGAVLSPQRRGLASGGKYDIKGVG